MITLQSFEKDEFDLQLITSELALDHVGNDEFLIQIMTIRLSPKALNAWILSSCLNSRDCYETNEEWEGHKAKQAEKREKFKKKILQILGISKAERQTIHIEQSLSEFFTVICITNCGKKGAQTHA